MEREGFVFYQSFWNATKHLPNDNQKNALVFIVQYGIDGIEPKQETDPIAFAMFLMAKPQLDSNNKKFEDGCKGGSYGVLGGRPKKTPLGLGTQTPNDNDNDNDNVNDKEKEKEKFGKFVKLYPEEFEKLKQRFTEGVVLDLIEKIENWIANKKKGKSPYVDYYQSIINRAKKDKKDIKQLTDLEIGQLRERRLSPEGIALVKQYKPQLDKYTPEQLNDLRKKALLHFVQNA